MSNGHFKYQAHVDGLRAIAILPVILFHAGLGFTGGYVGVDVFFVISGYLISGLILKDINADQFRITEFWERRIRRIVPALAVVVLATLIAGWFLFFPEDFKKLGQSMLAQALLVSNCYFYQDASYFAQGVDMKPLLHTWSLAVEEQFYLVFPFVLLTLKRFSRKSIVPGIVILCGTSFVLSVYCSYSHQRANFYLLPMRAWELLIGSLLAASRLPREFPRWLTELISGLGLGAILFAVFFYNSNTRFPGATALLPCLGAAAMIWANDRALSVTGKFLASRPMVFIGLISYSLYLWHWPVLVFFKYWSLAPLTFAQSTLLLAASFSLAILSWKFVETPFRKRVVFEKPLQIFAFGAGATAVVLLAGLMVFKMQGVPSRVPAAALRYLDKNAAEAPVAAISDRELNLADALGGNFNELGNGNKDLPISLFVWGDSHAKVIMPVLDSLCKFHSCRGVVATHPQTAPLLDYESHGVWSLNKDSVPYNSAVVQFILQRRIPNVLIVARWDYYIDADNGTDVLHRGMLATINALQNSGTRVWIMRQVPKYPWDVPKALASAILHGRNPTDLGCTLAEYRTDLERENPIFDGLRSPTVTLLDPTPLFVGASGRCLVEQDGRPLYYDSDHVNVSGAMLLRSLFEPIFAGRDAPSALAKTQIINP